MDRYITGMPKHHLTLFLLSAFASMGLAAYAYIGSFTRMLADDFCSLYFADRLGLLRSTWFWYITWSGRYTAFATDWLILKFALGPYKLHYVVPAIILLWLTFVTVIPYLYLREKGKYAFLHSFALGSIFLFIVLMLSPNVPQSLFWWNGMRSYALPLAVLTCYILIFQIINQYSKINPALSCSLGFILLFISGGMGEIIAIAQMAFILFLVSLQVLKLLNRPRTELIVLYSSLAGAVCSVIVVVLSPGNATRQALLPPSPDFIKLVSISIQAYGTFISGFFLDPAKITGVIGAILAAMWIGGHYQNFIPVKTRLIPAYIFGGIAISFVCFPPGVYGYSEPPPTRTMMIPVFFLTGGMLSASFLTGCLLAGRYGSPWLSDNMLILSITLLIGFSTIVTTWNLHREVHTYINFAEKWDQVDAQILQAKANNLEFVNIPALDNWAGLERPTDNEKYWPTFCYSSYYGIQVFGPPYP